MMNISNRVSFRFTPGILLILSGCATLGPGMATQHPLSPDAKTGKSCSYSLFSTIPMGGNNDIHSAMKSAGIQRITVVYGDSDGN